MKQHRARSVFQDRPFSIGTIVAGRYTILERIGEGSYGITYKAQQIETSSYVVIKQIKKQKWKKPIGRECFYWEKKIMSQLHHTSIPKWIETISWNRRMLYIMEYIEGESFETLIFQKEKAFSEEQVICYGEQLVSLLAYLYQKKIVHRDVRIPNVLLRNNEVVLIDFGLARIEDGSVYEGHTVHMETDFSFLGHFLLFLLYSSYENDGEEEKPWYEELSISTTGKTCIKKLLQIETSFTNWEEVSIMMSQWKQDQTT